MKKLLMLLAMVSTFFACENIEDNSSALQAEIDDVFFKALGSGAFVNDDDNTLTIQAFTSDQTLTLFLSNDAINTYELGADSPSFATFEAPDGTKFTTMGANGSGAITLSNVEENVGVSGSFNFSAILPGVDTLVVQKGLFFQVPFINQEIEIDEEEGVNPDPTVENGALVATLDGMLFNPPVVSATLSGALIVIRGTQNDEALTLIIRQDTEAGIYQLPTNGIGATYILEGSGVVEDAVSGAVRIFEHDMSARTIKGTFAYTTAAHTIAQGQFNVSY